MSSKNALAETADHTPEVKPAEVIELSAARNIRSEAGSVLSEDGQERIFQEASSLLAKILVFTHKITQEEYKEACRQMFDHMDRCVEAGFLKKNADGKYEPVSETGEGLLDTFLTRLKELREKTEKKKQAPKKSKEANKPANPLAIKMPDGRVFNNRQAFEQSLNDRLKNAETQEEKDQLEYYRLEYYEHLRITLEKLEGLIEKARAQVKTAIKMRKDPKKQRASLGVSDILAPLVEKGIIINDRGHYQSPPNFNLSDPLVNTANERTALLRRAYTVSQKINGFKVFEKGRNYAFQIRVEKDGNSGRDKIYVYNLMVISGTADLKEGEYLDFEAPNRLKLLARKFAQRLKQREKKKKS